MSLGISRSGVPVLTVNKSSEYLFFHKYTYTNLLTSCAARTPAINPAAVCCPHTSATLELCKKKNNNNNKNPMGLWVSWVNMWMYFSCQVFVSCFVTTCIPYRPLNPKPCHWIDFGELLFDWLILLFAVSHFFSIFFPLFALFILFLRKIEFFSNMKKKIWNSVTIFCQLLICWFARNNF